MIKLRIADIDFTVNEDRKELIKICKALSCEVRVDMMLQLLRKSLSVTELKKLNNISASAVLFHINVLKDAGLVEITYTPGKKGLTQMVSKAIRYVNINLEGKKPMNYYGRIVCSMPVGCYTDAKFYERWGIADTERNYILDTSRAFDEGRFAAQILWAPGGFVEYSFNNDFAFEKDVCELSFSLEICSEAKTFREDWKSDITFSVNGKEVLTWTSPGDFGVRRGKLNPPWWNSNSTQYGQLKTLTITEQGVYLDGIRQESPYKLADFNLKGDNKIRFKIECKENALYYGGFNLFGKAFGDFEQDIEMTAVYRREAREGEPINAAQDVLRKID